MNLRLLEIFCHVYQEGSFSRAAESLGLTQPTISSHIKALEAHFQAPLFDRLGRSIEPTPAGRALYAHGARMLALKAEAQTAMDHLLHRLEGTLRLAASTVPGEYVLPSLVGRFRRQYPKIQVQLRIGNTREMARHVAEGSADLGFVGGLWDDPELRFVELGTDPLLLAAPARGPDFLEESPVALETLTRLPLLVRAPGSGTRMALEQLLESHGLSLEECSVVAEFGTTNAVVEAVQAGVGVSFLSAVTVRRGVAHGGLRTLEVAGLETLERTFYSVSAPHRTPSPLREPFLRFLRDQRANLPSPTSLAALAMAGQA
jgi:DNA-binding transcriptional LysR family regulator